MKVCTRCKLPKPITDFAEDKTHLDGRRSLCKDCHNHTARKKAAAEKGMWLETKAKNDSTHYTCVGCNKPILKSQSYFWKGNGFCHNKCP